MGQADGISAATDFGTGGSPDVLTLATRLIGIVNGSWMSQATRVAGELCIPDLLADGPKRSEELAASADADAQALHRLLRALTTIDIVREREDGSFELTPMGGLLRSDTVDSLRSWTMYLGGDPSRLLDAVMKGVSGGMFPSGRPLFDHLHENPDLAQRFNKGMAELTRLTARSVADVYDFSAMSRVADVGGGYGELLAAVVRANPGITGVLFDLTHAIEAALPHLERAGVADRCELVAGSFFEFVPDRIDAYMLKSVIHDWDDERSREILQNCRSAMSNDAKLLLIERIIPERFAVSPEHQMLARTDLNMLVTLGVKERTEAEFVALLDSAGFVTVRTLPAGVGFAIIEAVRR